MAQQRTKAAASETAKQTRRVRARTADKGQEVASTAAEEGRRVASTATRRAQDVAETTGDEAKAVVGTAKDQAALVKEEATAQAQNMLEETRAKLQEQTATQAQRVAEGLSRLGEEALALADGRPEDAPVVREMVSDAADKLLEAADKAAVVAIDVEERGIEGLVDDVQRFARRRPGLFLFGTALVGFGVGRVVRMREPEPLDDEQTNGSASPAVAGSRRALPARSSTRRTATVGGR